MTGICGRGWAEVQTADRMARAPGHLARAAPEREAAGALPAFAAYVTPRGG
ncbi:hypothetical protein [Streptomyces sp. NPDC057280]|uniref:hypothetical protein n=1 Tax=Streptomyces sp. NPDC057280 TaxID=3346081 RepID=UPI00363C0A90